METFRGIDGKRYRIVSEYHEGILGRLCHNPRDIKVGDLVVTDYVPPLSNHTRQYCRRVVRKVLKLVHEGDWGSGVGISADSGGVCPCCDRRYSYTIEHIDSPWFIKVEEVK